MDTEESAGQMYTRLGMDGNKSGAMASRAQEALAKLNVTE